MIRYAYRGLAALTAASTAALLAAVLGAGAASAATRPGIVNDPTAGCQAIFSTNCKTPVVAVALPATTANELTPESDFALNYEGPSPATGAAYGNLAISPNNNLLTGTEDFAWQQIGHVPHIGGGPGQFKFTAFDRANYGGDPIYVVKYAPSGLDTNFCLTVSSKTRPFGLVMGFCQNDIRQAFIVTQHAPGLADLSGPTSAYYYAFAASQALNSQNHRALLDPHPTSAVDALAAVGNAQHVGAGLPSLNLWSSIP